MTENFISEEEAKRLAAGPLGRQLAEFPLLFSHPAFFGRPPSKERPTKINNGSISLINLGCGSLGITCQHVIEGFRNLKNKYDDAVFHIGFQTLDPLAQLIDESEELDIATIFLTDDQVNAITKQGRFGSSVFTVNNWPSNPPNADDYIVFGGYPGSMREVKSYNEVLFRTWSCGATKIDASSLKRFICPFEREYWVKAYGDDHHFDLNQLGGMSGGPAFIKREIIFEFIGIVSEYQADFDTMIFSSALLIDENGKLNKNV